MNDLQLDDIKVRITHVIKEDGVVVDLSSASTLQIILQDPNGTSTTFTAILTSDGTDGSIYYDTVSGDIDIAGLWKTQAKITINSGTYRTNVSSFRVYPNL